MSESLRRTLRRAIAFALYYSGVLWLVAAVKLRRRAVVLMYHRVLPASADTFSEDSIVVRPDTFARQMAFLRRYFRPASLETLGDLLERRQPLPSMSCVVTFDDGWVDNFQHALPILRSAHMPATVFVAADFIGSDQCFWQERLTRRMFAAIQHEGAARRFIESHVHADIGSMSRAQQRRILRDAVTRIKRWPRTQLETFEANLSALLRAGAIDCDARGDDRFMSWAQVADLAGNSSVRVGSHGCSHAPLVALAPDDAMLELRRARELIESKTGRATAAIAYPNGDFNETVVELARRAGYTVGLTTDKGAVDSEDEPLRLKRVNIHEAATQTMPEFLCTMLLIFEPLRRSQVQAQQLHAHPRH